MDKPGTSQGRRLAIMLLVLTAAFLLFFRKNLLERFWPAVPDNPAAAIGYIGCSNTRETVEGYHRLGGQNMWSYDKRYDAGAVVDWAKGAETGNKYWDVFDDLLAKHPQTNIIWWQLCIRHNETDTSYEHAVSILQAIRQRIPGGTIYVSTLADYTDGVCDITGTWGLQKAKELAQQLDIANDDVFPGPVLGPMSALETASDGCHLSSPDGKRKLGQQMRDFFDGQN